MPTPDFDLAPVLSPRQISFVKHWKGDAVEAARSAGYDDPRSAAFNLMQNEAICKLIREKQKDLAEGSRKDSSQPSFCRADVIDRLWQLANMPARETGETITGQVRASEALAEILAQVNHPGKDNPALPDEFGPSSSQSALPVSDQFQ